MLQVVIPTRTYGSPPARALVIEGYEVMEVLMADPQHSGRFYAELWRRGEGFVVVEDDVVPWPGAVKAMLECDQDWCGYEHPRTHVQYEPRSGFGVGLGCVKFSKALVSRYQLQDLLDGSQQWENVESVIYEMLQHEACHTHYPPVAHLKAHATVHRRAEMPT